MNLNDWSKECHELAVGKGWYDNGARPFAELIALCHSELSEALEDYRNGLSPADMIYEKFSCSAPKEYNCRNYLIENCKFCEHYKGKPCGIPSELADVLIRIFDMCGYYGIDLEQAVQVKHKYNQSRPMRHGGKVI